MRVYLDNNIFIYLEKGFLSIDQLEESAGLKFEKIFYSASHLQEALEIKGNNDTQRNNRINQRLDNIRRVTGGNYLNENLERQVYEYIEDPLEVLKTVTEVSFAQPMMKSMMNIVTDEQKQDIRNQLQLDPKRINNYTPNEVVKHLNQKLQNWGEDFTLLGMLEKTLSFFPPNYHGLSNKFAAIFEYLDMLGYWKDASTSKSNYARLWDSSHSFYAAHCDIFITDDKRTTNKAKVVYTLFGINTQILSSGMTQ